MRGHKLGEISKERDLGIQINQKLSASDQVLKARIRALKMLGKPSTEMCPIKVKRWLPNFTFIYQFRFVVKQCTCRTTM